MAQDPFTPQEAAAGKKVAIPSEVIEVFNEMLAEGFKTDSKKIVIRQKDIVPRITEKMTRNPLTGRKKELYNFKFDMGWLDVEPLYAERGWRVKFEKEDYNSQAGGDGSYFVFEPLPRYLHVPAFKDANNFSFASNLSPEDERHEHFLKQRLERGFDDTELWDLRSVFKKFIVPRLEAFKDCAGVSKPHDLTKEQWRKKIEDMIAGFRAWDDKNLDQKVADRLWTKGMKAFTEYYGCLWF
jgi:hypothetical protein